MPIRLLSEDTINKIAAGEVIERPANVVKELVENSLDAKSTSITVEIKGAGKKLIRVSDNGTGIPQKELKLALTRHATSKISDFDGLSSLRTMGFRGEALPSIASVSNLLIQSKAKSEPSGWEISLSAGKIKADRPWSGPGGTNVEITDLFFNTPARAKFLKSDASEKQKIMRMMEEIALSNFETAFSAASEGRKALWLPRAGSLDERVTGLFGAEFAGKLLRASAAHPKARVNALITDKESSLPSKSHQYFFVNRRPLNFNRSTLFSIYEAYREFLPAGRHPGVILMLEIDPSETDVNVHPTKREIRFSKEQEINSLIFSAIREALSKTPYIGILDKKPSPARGEDARRAGEGVAEAGILYKTEREPKVVRETLSSEPVELLKGEVEQQPKVIGQIFNLYVLAQAGRDFYIVDQHAAQERIRYEKYLCELESGSVSVQPLLFPETIKFAPGLAAVAGESLAMLKESGWDIEEFGTATFRVSAMPAILGNSANAKLVLEEILHAISEDRKTPPKERLEKVIRAACRSSIKAGDVISPDESKRLLKDLFACRSPFTCPHGRPTLFKVTLSELEKHFKRA
ncbi:MAG: DNA mismatch repair endonuclease MutL [Endomicrobiales bacterium]|nr:DNA mismatch repair endonuclease MutL [Endomicrobiales bacterium]